MSYTIPTEWNEAYLIKHTNMNLFEIRATPEHILDQIRALLYLDSVQQQEENRRANIKSKVK